MRTVTVTEKYRAVQEGRMAKSVFLQHMKREYPFYISQFDSFDSSVSILKNKGMLFEAKENDVYADSNKFSDEGLRRGTDAELEKMGIDSAGVVKEEELEKLLSGGNWKVERVIYETDQGFPTNHSATPNTTTKNEDEKDFNKS